MERTLGLEGRLLFASSDPFQGQGEHLCVTWL